MSWNWRVNHDFEDFYLFYGSGYIRSIFQGGDLMLVKYVGGNCMLAKKNLDVGEEFCTLYVCTVYHHDWKCTILIRKGYYFPAESIHNVQFVYWTIFDDGTKISSRSDSIPTQFENEFKIWMDFPQDYP